VEHTARPAQQHSYHRFLSDAAYDPSYMFGGLSIDDIPSAHIGKGVWNVLEGDEYKTARWDNSPKFAHYDPTHLLLTAVEWDHADIYPTEEKYKETFETLIRSLPKNGLLVLSERAHEYSDYARATVVTYGMSEHNDYCFSNVQSDAEGLTFTITNRKDTYTIKSPLISEYQAENITGCFALAHTIGIDPESIVRSIANHHGLKRRMEKRFEGDITIVDDIAHSPTKAASALSTVRKITAGKVIALFEPNTGNRQPSAAKGYDHAFKDADMIIIPRLTVIKTDKDTKKPLDGKELIEVISKTHTNTQYIEDDTTLIETLITQANKGDSIVFLGSHGFRGMIEELIKKIEHRSP
jgi:UDP-N-acetylmuramate: L-alanyl-gamma-D-glutamyl-meso-diaminopimelate ligase